MFGIPQDKVATCTPRPRCEGLFTIIGIVALLAVIVACNSVSGDGGESKAVARVGDGLSIPNAEAAVSETPLTSKVTPQPLPLGSGSALRSRATTDVFKGTVMRVDGVALAAPGPRLAGYRIRPGTERPLRTELLNEFVTLVRSDSGFDDSILRRCPPGTSIGFRLFRKTPSGSGSTNESVTELVLDFGCARLMMAEAGATDNPYSTFFDPSRTAFVALVNRALPKDRELSRLR